MQYISHAVCTRGSTLGGCEGERSLRQLPVPVALRLLRGRCINRRCDTVTGQYCRWWPRTRCCAAREATMPRRKNVAGHTF
eukprot:352012-Chlamydomonas_euryale.AAC.2